MITHYEYTGPENEEWNFEPTELGKINLIVGASGSGKTRFLNTLFNFASTMVTGDPFRSGKWKISIQTEGHDYYYEYRGLSRISDAKPKNTIDRELMKRKEDGEDSILVDRTADTFNILGQTLPKIDPSRPSITLFAENPEIIPLYRMFAHIMRRNFHDDALKQAISLQNINEEFIRQLNYKPTLDDFWDGQLTVNTKIYFFREYFKDLYEKTVRLFMQIFPTIKDVKVEFSNLKPIPVPIPIFFVKERGVTKWIPLHELSSGMQKVLLIITDILSLPGDCIYIIDEYENSLGINSIDFLPELLLEHGGDNQFIITTHHPHLINSMPMENWLVFNRKGSAVRIKSGRDLEEKYGRSKQKAFIKLINDPFYNEVA